ncbi:MAG: chemotaxis protein CheA [Alphaproteobacteria bacterium]|nr:chemotaxis protein CheA [Alphaproteobacteria bacterium]
MNAATDAAQVYLEEVADLLVQLEEALLGLEQAPDDRDLLDTAFRALHTIKGSGAMFGFDAVADFTHHLENAFDQVRKGKLKLSSTLVGIALASKDHIRALIEHPAEVDPAAGDKLLAEVTLCMAAAGRTPVAVASDPGEPSGLVTWRIRFRLARDVVANGTNPLRLLDELRELGPCEVVALTDGIPVLEEIDVAGCYVAWDVVLTTNRPKSAIEEVFIFVIDGMELAIDRLPEQPSRLGDILVRRGDLSPEVAEAIAARQEKLGTLLVREGVISEDRLRSALTEQQHMRAEAGKATVAPAVGSIRVPAERLDSLMDQVGELVIAQARLRQMVMAFEDPAMRSIAEEIERLSNGLRDTTMGIRMVPIGTLFGRFRRLVRDLAQELGKSVQLTMAGEETELDKTVIERLADPLIHVIRNSLDHGLEDARTRQQAGKEREGRIHLSAAHSGAQVLITVRDDGRGLDRDAIRAKAVENGRIAEDTALSDGELFQLIFAPGFSTASTVTSVSGRGVGMDVVKRTIETLRGTIDVASTPGAGTAITFSLPLTLAIIDGLLVRVGHGRYVIPLLAVVECVELSEEAEQRHKGRNFLNIRGDLIPFLRLREAFHSPLPADPYQKVVIVSTGERRIGLVVDQLLGGHQTVIKSLSKLHADVGTFSGATILGDGTVALILDIAHLVARGQNPDAGRKAV